MMKLQLCCSSVEGFLQWGNKMEDLTQVQKKKNIVTLDTPFRKAHMFLLTDKNEMGGVKLV